VTVWADYQKCRVCGALLGWPCTSKTGFIASADEWVASKRDKPHTGRKLRAAAARDAKFGSVINRPGGSRG
jgi:hypothetical protein